MFLNLLREKISSNLALLQKYTQINITYFITNSFWLTIGQFVSSLASFAISIAFAHFLSKENFGLYKYITGTITGLLTIFTLSGANNALLNSVARGYDQTLNTIFTKKVRWGLLGLLSGIIASTYYFFQHNAVLALLILICALFTPIFDPLYLFTSFLNGKGLFKTSVVYDSILKICFALGIATTIILTKNIFIIVFCYFALNFFLRLFFYLRTKKLVNPNSISDPSALTYGKHLSVMKIASLITGYIQQIALFHFLGPASIALCAIAIAPVEQVRGLLAGISNIFIQKFSQDKWKIMHLTSFAKKIFPFISFLSVGIILYILLAPFLYNTFFVKYPEAIGLSQLYAPSLIFTGINILLSSILSAKRLIKEQYIINIFDTAVNIFISFPFIYWYGVKGLLISYIILKVGDSLLISYLLFRHPR